MPNKFSQISLFDIYEDVNTSFIEKKSNLVSLLEKHIDFSSLISYEFHRAFYSNIGRKHKYHLESFIKALIIQKLFAFNLDSQLIFVLKNSDTLRDFCGFDKIPDGSYFTRFKQRYCNYLVDMFHKLVDITEPICREIDSKKADYLIFDTTGIEPYVAENNPKFLNAKLKEAKKLSKVYPQYNPYSGVYSMLPNTAKASIDAKQQYINGHYCYAHKVGIMTNGIGIIRNISFFDDDFKNLHSGLISKKSNNPDIDKEISNSHALKPILSDFFAIHPDMSFSTFLGDSAFDSYDNYTMLRNEFHFKRACIPLNRRNSKQSNIDFDQYGTPLCPLDKTPFIFAGKSGGKNRSLRFKWICHKSVPVGSKRICICPSPCTESSYGKCTYTYPDKDFRMYPGIPRNTEHWDNLYKHRVYIERTIFLLKDCFGLNALLTHNTATIKADVYLAAITQLIGVMLAKAIHKLMLFKSIRKLVKMIS